MNLQPTLTSGRQTNTDYYYFNHNPLSWLNTENMEDCLQSIEQFRIMHHPKPLKKVLKTGSSTSYSR